MYQCTCCSRLCNQPVYLLENRGEAFGFPTFEEIRACPFCGGGLIWYEKKSFFWEEDGYDGSTLAE